jgi:hypothetical protein
MKTIGLVFLVLSSSAIAQSQHFISGRIRISHAMPAADFEVVFSGNRGIVRTKSDSAGRYRLLIPTGPGEIYAIPTKEFNYYSTYKYRLQGIHAICNRDLICDIRLVTPAENFVEMGVRFSDLPPAGQFHFHPDTPFHRELE